jgi:lambda repressor-like predicted transcriptional regulator
MDEKRSPFFNVKDAIEEHMYGKEGVAQRRRAAELEHECELVKIRRESHALIWTGTAEELTETIRRWYESGWLLAESSQDAFQKAAIHFVDTAGKPIIKPTEAKAAQIEPRPKAESLSRRAFITPLLDAKGWSILDWANEANVSHATAQDYLDNKTKPYPSTRKKLAKALGLNMLPK